MNFAKLYIAILLISMEISSSIAHAKHNNENSEANLLEDGSKLLLLTPLPYVAYGIRPFVYLGRYIYQQININETIYFEAKGYLEDLENDQIFVPVPPNLSVAIEELRSKSSNRYASITDKTIAMSIVYEYEHPKTAPSN